MISISERLRARQEPVGDGSGKWRPDGLCQEAAEVNDALVAAVERILDERHEPSGEAVQQCYAALAKAKGKQE